jgi:hypothetical protein
MTSHFDVDFYSHVAIDEPLVEDLAHDTKGVDPI